MQYNRLSALAQDTALRLEEAERSPAVALVAAGETAAFFSYGGSVDIGCFVGGAFTLTVDGKQAASGNVSAVYSAHLSAGRHTVQLSCSNGLALITGGKKL